MAVVTSIMRLQQVFLARADAVLRPLGLTFARYEVLMLLSFSRRDALPLGKIGERLQVNPASVTNAVDRLEADGLVTRRSNPDDGRVTLAALTPSGRRVAAGGDPGRQRAGLHRHRRAGPEGAPAVWPVGGAPAGCGGFLVTVAYYFDIKVMWHECPTGKPGRRPSTVHGCGQRDSRPCRGCRSNPRTGRRGQSCPVATRTRGAPMRRCTARDSGRCVSSPASARPRTPTGASRSYSGPAATASPRPSTCPRCSGVIPTIHWPRARWAGPGWPSTRWPTWRRSSRASTSGRSRPP